MSSLLQQFLREQGYALLEPRADGTFTLLGELPQWFAEIWGQPTGIPQVVDLGAASPFLENFLHEARQFWNAGRDDMHSSGIWIEQIRDRKEIPLEAAALRLGKKPLLFIHCPQRAFQQESQVFQTARESRLAQERLLKEIQKKEILLHCIIHDLSQPLAAIRGCFECLAIETVAPKAKHFIDIGKQQTERQEALIREVLQTFAEDLKSEMDTGSTPRSAADLLSCARETVSVYSPVFAAKGAVIQLSSTIDAAGDWKVVGDESRLRRILSNLVENALRYAPRHSQVTIGLEEDGGLVRCSVEDEGPGLPPGATPAKIFALLGKGKDCGGKAGLGLYFCRITVERWGGAVGCEPRGGKGARFWFRLPRPATQQDTSSEWLEAQTATAEDQLRANAVPPRVDRAPANAMQGAGRKAPLQKRGPALRILLADDQEEVREVTGYMLRKEGHRITPVANGRDALQELAKHRFDVVLLDEEMPGMKGSEVVRAIRLGEQKVGTRQFVLALTGNTTAEDQQRLMAAGMDGCLGKPFRGEELRRKLAEAFPAPADERRIAQTQERSIKADLLARLGGNARLLGRMIRTFRKDSLKKIAAMKRALRRQDGNALATAAHALKGSASLFGSDKATQLAQKLQDMGRKEELGDATPALRELTEVIVLLREKLRGYDRSAQRNTRRQKPPKAPSRSEKTKHGR